MVHLQIKAQKLANTLSKIVSDAIKSFVHRATLPGTESNNVVCNREGRAIFRYWVGDISLIRDSRPFELMCKGGEKYTKI